MATLARVVTTYTAHAGGGSTVTNRIDCTDDELRDLRHALGLGHSFAGDVDTRDRIGDLAIDLRKKEASHA